MKTAMTELKDFLHTWTSLDGERLVCTVEYLKEEIDNLLIKEKQDIIDAYFDGTAQFANDAEIVRPLKAEDYFTQKYEHK